MFTEFLQNTFLFILVLALNCAATTIAWTRNWDRKCVLILHADTLNPVLN